MGPWAAETTQGTVTTDLIRQITGAAMAAALGIALLTGSAQEPAQLTSGTLATSTTDAAAEPAQDCTVRVVKRIALPRLFLSTERFTTRRSTLRES